MSLPSKTGDFSHLKNYPPISFVNTDAKVFTKIINGKFTKTCMHIINQYQLGFIPGSHIAENSMITQIIMENARSSRDIHKTALALLLDQEKGL